ncbi:ribonuclease H-like domain-containing protein [Tanacetum coccineum]
MYDEYNALVKNGTWILVPRPSDVNLVRSMWLFKHKFYVDGNLSCYKARLVANGSSQQLGVNFDETFSPVVKPAIIRMVLSLVVAYLLIYVDDIILTASSPILLQQIVDSLHKEFDMTDIGALNYFLGISATRHSIDWGKCPSTRRSTSGYCVFLCDNLLSWSSKRHHTISRSSAEAEYRGVANVVAETAWIRNLLHQLHSPFIAATIVLL